MTKTRLLIVEDDTIIGMDIAKRVEKLGYGVPTIVGSGQKAVEKAKALSPDLVLIDMMLDGEMDGIEVAEIIRSRFGIPVIFLADCADEKKVMQAKLATPFGCITKPIRDIDLKINIEMTLYIAKIDAERRRAERELSKREEKLSLTLNAIGDAVIATDINGRITRMNPVAETLTGWKFAEAKGQPIDNIFNIISEFTRKKVENPIEKVLKEGRIVSLEDHTVLISKDGTEYIIRDSSAPIRVKDGNLVGVVTVFRDITEKRKDEISLIQSERYYRTLLHSMHEDILIIDRDYQITDVNNTFLVTYGLHRNEVIGRPCYEISHGYNEPCVRRGEQCELHRVFNTGDIVRCTHKHLHADGEKRFVEIIFSPMRDEKGNVIQVVEAVHDITELIQANEELRKSEANYREIFDSVNDIIIVHDIKTGKLLDVNRKTLETFGYGRDEFFAMAMGDWSEGQSPYSQKEAGKWIQEAAEGEPQMFEWRCKKKNGDLFWTEVNLKKAFINENDVILAVIRNIEDRKKTESELKELGQAVQHASEGIVVTERDGRIVYTNPAFLQITGYSQDEIIGQTPRILKSGRQRVQFYRDLWQTILSGNLWRGRIVNKRKDGSLYTAECSISPVKNGEGHILNFVWITRDISTEIKLEEWVRQSQKMESIGTLAGGIAHDFNNILATIVGCTELSLEDVSKETAQYKNLQEVLKAGIRAKDLVQQILTFSRQTDQELQPLNVQIIIKEVLKLSRSTLPSTIEIKQNISNQCGLVMADATQVHQIAMNLITNAYHAMGEDGGTLEVTLREVDLGIEALKNKDLIPGTYVCLTVSDTGIGMEKAIIDRIFEPYFTTKGKDKGTGLGLSVVHGIVSSYKGDIRVYSEPGKGTMFSIYLPVIETRVEKKRAEETSTIRKGSERILLVDDEDMVLRMEKQMLELLGYYVTPRTSSIEALEAFRAAPDNFDLVITDMTMPNMTGVKLSQKILEIKPEIPIIICTGFSERISEEKAKALGIREYVMKPVVKRELAKTLRAVLDE